MPMKRSTVWDGRGVPPLPEKGDGNVPLSLCPIAVLVSGVVMVALGPIEKELGLPSFPREKVALLFLEKA